MNSRGLIFFALLCSPDPPINSPSGWAWATLFLERVDIGYWYARSLAFLDLRWVNILEWARLPGDALFIIGGALPLLWLCWQALRYPNPRRIEAEAELPQMLYTHDSEPGKG